MSARAYYNEIDPYAAAWLRNLCTAGLVPAGDVDERSIALVQPDDVRGYTQAHFFAGLGGWAHACRLAGWPDERPIWTGSCPCQPFSVAGKRAGADDPRHLWPDFFRLVRAVRPAVVMGEQVAGAAGYGWLDGVRADLEGEGYASRGVDIPACAVDAPHIRSRLYWVAVADAASQPEREPEHAFGAVARERPRPDAGRRVLGLGGPLADAASGQLSQPLRRPQARDGAGSVSAIVGNADRTGLPPSERKAVLGAGRRDEERAAGEPGRALGDAGSNGDNQGRGLCGEDGEAAIREGRRLWSEPRHNGRNSSFWSDAEWIVGADGKARRIGVGVRRVDHGLPAGLDSLCPKEEGATALRLALLTHGEPARVGKLKGLGNAIVPQLAAEVITAFMECEP